MIITDLENDLEHVQDVQYQKKALKREQTATRKNIIAFLSLGVAGAFTAFSSVLYGTMNHGITSNPVVATVGSVGLLLTLFSAYKVGTNIIRENEINEELYDTQKALTEKQRNLKKAGVYVSENTDLITSIDSKELTERIQSLRQKQQPIIVRRMSR